ncbi:EamA family transporter [Francisella philomiragia]|uniref:SMR family transporter n=1 Tax=Francisella philomiragia TaxID=28110 RepID=UPI000B58CC00|nr:SMR family transporter [Francisella philomiragia]MBK2094144.1 EamA family transporter [Francisella philomiragia]
MLRFMINNLYIFMTVAFAVSSQLIIKWQMSSVNLDSHITILDKFIFAFSMLFKPYIILSLILTLLSGLSWMIAMTKFEISYAYPFTTLGFVLILFFSNILFHEPLTWQKIIGVILIILGLIISSKG